MSHCTTVLHADEFCARTVADLARFALRQPGGIARIGDLSVSSYRPCDPQGGVAERSRIWLIEDADGRILAEMPSLFAAVHSVAR